jgi:uncharacterized protein (DUF1697 family)
MSDRHVALIRGINVGTAKRVGMAELRETAEALGFRDVRTLLNSGNLVFSASAKAGAQAGQRLGKALATQLGVTAQVMVLSAAQFDEVMADNPLLGVGDNPSRLMVSVFGEGADRAAIERLATQDWSREALAVGRRAAYLWCPNGVIESRVAAAMAKALGDAVTTRNWATVTKLKGLLGVVR